MLIHLYVLIIELQTEPVVLVCSSSPLQIRPTFPLEINRVHLIFPGRVFERSREHCVLVVLLCSPLPL